MSHLRAAVRLVRSFLLSRANKEFQNQLTEGTPVVTGGGIYGTVKSIDLAKNTVEVKIARDVVVTVDKSYVFKDMANAPLQQK